MCQSDDNGREKKRKVRSMYCGTNSQFAMYSAKHLSCSLNLALHLLTWSLKQKGLNFKYCSEQRRKENRFLPLP